MPSNLLVLALLAGFCFIHSCDRFRFRAQLLDGYRLLLHCSLAGAGILATSRLLVCGAKLIPLFWTLTPYWKEVADVPYLGTFLLCLPVSFAAAWIWNCFVDSERQRENEINEHGDYLMGLMQAAVNGDRMVSITFDSRKWYAGYIIEAPNLKPSEKYFTILPIISGYRDKDTLEATRTLRYDDVYSRPEVNPSDFVIILPLAPVRTASLFDPDVYEDHFAVPNRKQVTA